jgi:hypothetical protein
MLTLLLSALFLVALVIAFIECGRRIRLRRKDDDASKGLSVIDGAVFGLMGLLLAFSFSGAEGRFETRRQLIVQETNAIGTAYLRVDLLPEAAQPQIRYDFRAYVDSRITFYKEVTSDRARTIKNFEHSIELQKKVWTETVAAAKQTGSPAVLSLVVSSLNDMIDITTTRLVALQTHPPLAIYITLVLLALASALIAGFGMGDSGKRPWLHTLVYAVALTATVYTIIDLEFPRIGIVRVDRYDQTLIDQRNSMKDSKAF